MFTHELHDTLVRIEGVRAQYGATVVLDGVDAEIKDVVRPAMTQGQVVAILGPSGRGKTTLLRIIAGLASPSAGRVLIENTPVRAGRVGVVHQQYPLFEHKRVIDNLLVRCRDADKAHRLLARFGLAERAQAWPCELSGGERQRAAILQQVMCGHTYLVMDEPFSGLDPVTKAKACELIAEVSQLDEKTTILVVTHDIREAVKIADTLWLLGHRDGGAPSSIVATYNLIERELAWSPGIEHTPQFAELVRELAARFASL